MSSLSLCQIGFASEAWPRPGLAEPRSALIAGFGLFHQLVLERERLSSPRQASKRGLFWVRFWDPETDMFEALIVNSVLVFVPLMRFYIGTAQLKKVLGA